jgi:rhodanese-related sulfurtransferase
MNKCLLTVPFLLVAGAAFAAADGASGAATSGAAKAPAFKAHVLSNVELDKLLEHPDKVLLVDVRRPDELISIGGFPAYFSVQQSEVEKNLAWIPHDRPIVTVSNHAARAGKTADLLASKGFKVAGAIGAETYEKAGGTLSKVVKPPERAQGAGAAAAGATAAGEK